MALTPDRGVCDVVFCISASRRGLAALLILVGGQCESLGTGMSKSTDSHVFFCTADSGVVYRHNKMKNMKKLGLLALLPIVISGCSTTSTITQERAKERQAVVETTLSEVNRKASKAARDEAKRLKKEGWQVAPGALPLEKQLDRSYMMQYEFDESLYPKYIMGEAMSIGTNYDGAKMQALELAKQNLAGNIQTEVAALANNSVSNEQLTNEQAATITKTISESKSLIVQSLGRTVIIVEAYRTLNNKNKEVLVRIAYSYEMAMQASQKAIIDELEDEGDALREELDTVFSQRILKK